MIINFTISDTKFQIDLDGTTYSLTRLGINQDKESKNFGSDTSVHLGYFSQIKSAVSKAIKDQMGSQTDEVNLKEFLEKYNACTESVNNQIGEK